MPSDLFRIAESLSLSYVVAPQNVGFGRSKNSLRLELSPPFFFSGLNEVWRQGVGWGRCGPVEAAHVYSLSPQCARTIWQIPACAFIHLAVRSSCLESWTHLLRMPLVTDVLLACTLSVSGQCANLLARGKRLPNTMRVAPFKFRPCTRFPSDLAVQAQGT